MNINNCIYHTYKVASNYLVGNFSESYQSLTIYRGRQKSASARFGEFCSCCCLPLLPQLACSILATWGPPYTGSLYKVEQNERSLSCVLSFACQLIARSWPSCTSLQNIAGILKKRTIILHKPVQGARNRYAKHS